MNARRSTALLLLAALGLLAAATACSGQDGDGSEVGPTGTALTQSDSQGGVRIDVAWVTPDTLGKLDSEKARGYGLEDYVLLEVRFTTHSGDLSRLDMVALSAVRVGGQEYTPQAWASISDDSHHRAGVLVFARKSPDGVSLDEGPVELVMRGIAGVPERVFRWQWPERSG